MGIFKFEKVSYKQFKENWLKYYPISSEEERIRKIYDGIKLPERSTKRSSGYDFYYPGDVNICMRNGASYIIPTGIRCVFFEDGYDLSLYPRSGMGFKYRVHLDNTVGIIDNDYFESDNEGHIMVKLSCDSRDNNGVIIKPGDRFVQGIVRQFFVADNDDETEKKDRTGGMGSTGK